MIPKELRDLPQWVCCRRDNKIPMRATEYKAASSSDPSTWCDYETALESVTDGNYEYLGFVFHDNGIVGIDIDVGFTDESNIMLTDETYDILTRCHSYTELSKSGRGFHIFVKGKLSFKGKNNGRGLEIYSDSRYFVMTGKQRFYDEVIENQDAIDYIVNTYFKETVREITSTAIKPRYYSAIDKVSIVNGKVKLSKEYPEIKEGSRNNSLLSIGGQLMAIGYSKKQIYDELMKLNQQKVRPMLSVKEIQAIVNSVEKYRR